MTIYKPLSLLRNLVYSLMKVRALQRKDDVLLKTLTLANAIGKFLSYTKAGSRGKWLIDVKWPQNDCLAKVSFFDIEYLFYLSKGYDFFLLLNPYFHEYEITSLVQSLLNENDIFIDVGAYAGLYTLIASKRVGINGKVISIEPNSETLDFLRLNIELNELKNVHVIPKAAGENLGRAKLYYCPGHASRTSAFRRDHPREMLKCFEVEVTTLDQIFERMIKPKSVKMVKIDTEGFDLYVLKGAKSLITKIQYLVIEQNNDEVRSYLAKYGFRLQTLEWSNCLFAKNSSLR